MLSAISTCQNHLLPIYRLPSEILSMIFKMTEGSATNSFRPLETRAPLNLAQVSKLWREITLNTPSLWVAIDVMNIGLAPIFLERSQSAALEITVASGGMYDEEEDGSDSGEEPMRLASELEGARKAYDLRGRNPHDFLAPLLPHIARWRSLILEVPSTNKQLEGFLLPSAAPALTTFCALELGHSPVLPTLHPDLFNKQLPNLNRLSLGGVALPLQLAPTALKCLRYLTLEGFDYEPEETAHFLRLLQGCPLLESLTLQTMDAPCADEMPIVSLQHLRTLDLDSVKPDFVRDLLSHIVAPSSLRVGITIHHRHLPTIAPSLNVPLSHVGSHPIHNWSFKQSTYWLTISGTTAQGTELMQLGLYSPQPTADMSVCFNHILPGFTSESLSFNSITTGYYGLSLAQPSTLFMVTSLSFVDCARGFLDVLFTCSSFPRLKNLKVENCNIDSDDLTILACPRDGQLDPGPDGHAQVVDTCRVDYFDGAVGVPEVLMVRRFNLG